MKIWIFLEGPSDVAGLKALFEKCGWSQKLKDAGHGIQPINLDSKSNFFRKIGARAAEKLKNNPVDLAVAAPDLHPTVQYRQGPFAHEDLGELRLLQSRLVRTSLLENFNDQDPDRTMTRFLPSALKHDFEAILLCADDALREHTRPLNGLGNWQHPEEDQNHNRPPKRVVEDIFLRRSQNRRAYRDTKDAPAVLGRVTDLRSVLFDDHNRQKCPVFKEMIDWVAGKTEVAAY